MRRLIVAIAIAAIGCGTTGSVSTRFVPTATPAPFEARPVDHPVDFMTTTPDRPFIELGFVSAIGCRVCNEQLVSEKLRARVRLAGGDAVINVRMSTAPAGTVGAGALTIQGTAIRWR